MRREHTLRRQLESLHVLGEAITAMKSLSAHHLRAARARLAAARTYRDGIGRVIGAAGIEQSPPPNDATAILLVATDVGLCDGYNLRLVEAAVKEWRRRSATRLYCVGRQPALALQREEIPVTHVYPAVTSVGVLTRRLLTLADDVFGDYVSGGFSSLYIVSARFEGVGAFSAVATRLLPIAPAGNAPRVVSTPYADPRHLAQAAVREFVYSTLDELLLDALAAEQGMRLVATQAAEEWLEERTAAVRRELASVHRESSTQEVLDLAVVTRQRRREPPGGAHDSTTHRRDGRPRSRQLASAS